MAYKRVSLPVQRAHVVLGCGATSDDVYVPCPIRGATALATCEDCARLEYITSDDHGHADAIVCRPALPRWRRLLERLRAPTRVPLHRLVHRGVRCATCDASPPQLERLMAEARADAVPIVDYERGAVGLVTRADLSADGRWATALMRRAVTIGEHETLARAVERLRVEGAQHLVIVDAADRVVGLVAAAEVAALARG